MIVDDSMVIRRKIERCDFITEKSEVRLAENGSTAVALFNEFHPDLITMDLTMPQMDGVECVKHIIALDRSACILVVSALTDKDTALQAVRNGARGFLPKPFNEEQLSSALRKIITSKRSYNEREE